MTTVKAYELRNKSKDELTGQLLDLKKEMATLRAQKVSANNQKVSQIKPVRKAIARVLTVIRQKQRENLKEFYAGKKYVPLDLRTKKTRALRRALTTAESSRKTARQMKKERHFPMRKYAVKA